MPYAFYRFPQERKDRAISNYYLSAASDWLRARVIGKVALHEGHTITAMRSAGDGIDATLSDGTKLRAQHILLGTGYQVDLDRLTMLHPSLRVQIASDRAIPVLNHWFESSVAGLYFTGLTSLRAFGPLYRFVAGCGATAERITESIASQLRARRAA